MPAVLTDVAVRTIKESRQLRLQSFNEYRKRFNLQPYTSFRHFTGEKCASVCRFSRMHRSIDTFIDTASTQPKVRKIIRCSGLDLKSITVETWLST